MRTAGKYWFPAKKYGWGWGPPCRWQGWVVLFVYFVLLWLGFRSIRSYGFTMHLLYLTLLSLGLILVCWLTGEKPRWRSGEE
jgi:hypothetical protein